MRVVPFGLALRLASPRIFGAGPEPAMKPPQGFTRSLSLALDDYLERSRPLASNPGNGPDPGQVRCSLEGGREYLLASQRPEGK